MFKIEMGRTDWLELAATAFCASTDAVFPELATVRLDMSAKGVEAVATDRYRLAIVEKSFADLDGDAVIREGEAFEALVPARAFKDAVKKLASAARRSADPMITGAFDLEAGAWELSHAGAGLAMGGALINRKFPDFKRVVPSTVKLSEGHTVVDPEFLATFARMRTYMGAGRDCRLAFDGAGGRLSIMRWRLGPVQVLIAPFKGGPDAMGGDAPDVKVLTPGGEVKRVEVDRPALVAERDALAGELEAARAEVERLKAALIAPVEPVEPTPVEQVEQVEQVDRFAGVPNLTAKMRERLARALDRGLAPTVAVEYATGTLKGKRSTSLLEVLTAGGEQ